MASEQSCTRELEIAIPWDEVSQKIDERLDAYRAQANIPGFRPGKVPLSVVKMRFKDAAQQDVLDSLVPQHFWAKAREEELQVVGRPNIVHMDVSEGEQVSFKAEFDVVPPFELGEYSRLEIPYREPEVPDEMLDAELERLREQQVSFRNEDPRPLAEGDIAVVALRSEMVEGIDAVDQDETTIELGDGGQLPGFTEALTGKSPGDDVDFSIDYPEDFGNDKLAGQSVAFHAHVKAVRVKELPELDDAFAADVNENFTSLDELTARIREELEQYARRNSDEEAKERIVDKLVGAHEFAVPNTLVDDRIVSRLERNLRSLASQGVDLDQANLDIPQLRELERPAAERDVKASLLLERIAKVESIQASQEEIDEQVKFFAEREKISTADARAKLAEEGALDRISNQITSSKTLTFLLDEAVKVDPPAEADPEDSPEEAPAPEE